MEIGRQRDPRNRRSKTLPSSATVPPPLPFSSPRPLPPLLLSPFSYANRSTELEVAHDIRVLVLVFVGVRLLTGNRRSRRAWQRGTARTAVPYELLLFRWPLSARDQTISTLRNCCEPEGRDEQNCDSSFRSRAILQSARIPDLLPHPESTKMASLGFSYERERKRESVCVFVYARETEKGGLVNRLDLGIFRGVAISGE